MASEEELANLQRLSNDFVNEAAVRRLGNEGFLRRLMNYRDHLLGNGSRARPLLKNTPKQTRSMFTKQRFALWRLWLTHDVAD